MHDVIIYTADGCSHCHEAKDFFKENNIKYAEYNVSEDKAARKELIKMGVMSIPYIIIGNTALRGFDKEKIESLLKL